MHIAMPTDRLYFNCPAHLLIFCYKTKPGVTKKDSFRLLDKSALNFKSINLIRKTQQAS